MSKLTAVGLRDALCHGAKRSAQKVLIQLSSRSATRRLGDAGLRRAYDHVAPGWQRMRAEDASRAAFDGLLARLPQSEEGLTPNSALDVATGAGLGARLLLDRFPGAKVAGVDISPRMVAEAQRHVPEAEFRVAAARQLPYADGQFGLVTSFDGVHVGSELARVTAPGGTVAITYSQGAKTPVARPVAAVAAELEAAGMRAVTDDSGSAWHVWARKPQ